MNLELALESPNFATADERQRWWPPRPATGLLWADILWLAVVVALERHVVPSLVGGAIPIDILTPWLVISFVVDKPSRALVLWALGAFMLETSGNAPKGLYICGYWVILSALFISRRMLSWRHIVPWLVTMFFASFWLMLLESVTIFVRQDPEQLDLVYFLNQVLRVVVSCLIGMACAQPWMARFKGDRIASERHYS